MTVLVRATVPGMTTDTYDKVSGQLTPRMLSARGFVAHVAFAGDDEIRVSEIWESRDDFQEWFDNNVKPHVPGVEIDVVKEVHNVIIKK